MSNGSNQLWEVSLWDGEGGWETIYVANEAEANRLAEFLNSEDPEGYGWEVCEHVPPVASDVDSIIAETLIEKEKQAFVDRINSEYQEIATPIYKTAELADWESELLGVETKTYTTEERDFDAEYKARLGYFVNKGYATVEVKTVGSMTRTRVIYNYS